MNFKNLVSAYIKHLENGYSEKSFDLCSYLKIEEYAREEKLIEKIEKAKCTSQKFWESLAIYALTNNYKYFSYDTWKFVMKSRFGWTEEPKIEESTEQKVIDVELICNPNLKLPEKDNTL
jgi:hypothetical protein